MDKKHFATGSISNLKLISCPSGGKKSPCNPTQLQLTGMPVSTETRMTRRCPGFPPASGEAADQDNEVPGAKLSGFMHVTQSTVIHSHRLKIYLIYHGNRHSENVSLGVLLLAESPPSV